MERNNLVAMQIPDTSRKVSGVADGVVTNGIFPPSLIFITAILHPGKCFDKVNRLPLI